MRTAWWTPLSYSTKSATSRRRRGEYPVQVAARAGRHSARNGCCEVGHRHGRAPGTMVRDRKGRPGWGAPSRLAGEMGEWWITREVAQYLNVSEDVVRDWGQRH